MKHYILFIAGAIYSSQALAFKPCKELKAEIATKLEAAGVKSYALEIVANDNAGEAKVVGSCDGGTKKITYSKK